MNYHSIAPILGKDPYGVIAYPYDENESEHWAHGLFLGINGQCVEYARRWMVLVRGLTFPAVDHASDLWKLDHVLSIEHNQKLPFLSIKKNRGLPRVGDLLIYQIQPDFPHGHVAVVVKVTPTRIGIAEQNMSDEKWNGRYSRWISIKEIQDEPGLLGWKTVLETKS